MKNRKAKEWAERLALQAAVVIVGGLIVFGGSALGGQIGVRTEAELSVLPAAAAHGIGREPAAARYLGSARAEGAVSLPAYDEYVEGEGPAPEWYRPDEPMAAGWIADVADINVGNKSAKDTDVPCNKLATNLQSDAVDYKPHPPIGIDPGGIDYNIEPEVVPDWILDVPLDRWMQEYIHGLCEESGLPYTLAVAVIEQESHYTPWVISDSDDYGLMQINAVCHGWLADELGITDFLDPCQNARAGIWLLADYYARYGYASGALMCYNMGELRAQALFDQGIYATDYSERVMGIRERLEKEGR